MKQRAIVLVLLVITTVKSLFIGFLILIMSETFSKRMPVHEFKNFLTKYLLWYYNQWQFYFVWHITHY